MNTLHDDLLAITADHRFVTPEARLNALLRRIKAETPPDDSRAYMCECIGTNCTVHNYAAGYNKGVREFGAVIDAALAPLQ